MLKSTCLYVLVSCFSLPGIAQLPDAPQAQTTDVKFWAVIGLDAVANIGDGYTTVALISSRKRNCSVEVGSPELYGRHPKALRVSAAQASIFAVNTFIAYKAKRHNVRLGRIPLWPVLPGYDAYVHSRAAGGNIMTCAN
jgi:hypothetical protein